MRALQIHQHGGPEVLTIADIPEPAIESPHDVIVQVATAGVNFVDIYQREGRYPGVTLPMRLGIEAAGTVIAAGADAEWRKGDRVAFAPHQGACAERVKIDGRRAIGVPDALSLDLAAAVLEHGMTAHMLLFDVHPMRGSETLIVHAAAGGVGGLLVQWAKHLGARVIGIVSSEAKAAVVRDLGADAAIVAAPGAAASVWVDAVAQLTALRGADVVYDSVGRDTLAHSFDCLGLCGHLILYGASSGPAPAVDPLRLMRQSLTLSRPVLPHYVSDASSLRRRASAVFDAVLVGDLRVRIHAKLPLTQAATAQTLLATRATAGKLLLDLAGV